MSLITGCQFFYRPSFYFPYKHIHITTHQQAINRTKISPVAPLVERTARRVRCPRDRTHSLLQGSPVTASATRSRYLSTMTRPLRAVDRPELSSTPVTTHLIQACAPPLLESAFHVFIRSTTASSALLPLHGSLHDTESQYICCEFAPIDLVTQTPQSRLSCRVRFFNRPRMVERS